MSSTGKAGPSGVEMKSLANTPARSPLTPISADPKGNTRHLRLAARPFLGAGFISLAETPKGSRQSQAPSTSGQVPAPGFKFYVPSESKSNRSIITLGLNRSLFPGNLASPKSEIFAAMTGMATGVTHFLILFRCAEKAQYRGLYGFMPLTNALKKFHGAGPSMITGDQSILQYLKYNTAQKIFTVVPTKHLALTIDGFTIDDLYWTSRARKLAMETAAMMATPEETN